MYATANALSAWLVYAVTRALGALRDIGTGFCGRAGALKKQNYFCHADESLVLVMGPGKLLVNGWAMIWQKVVLSCGSASRIVRIMVTATSKLVDIAVFMVVSYTTAILLKR